MLTAEDRAQTERKTLDDDERRFMRAIIDGFRMSYADESMWVDRLEMALDSADHWKKCAEAAEAQRGDEKFHADAAIQREKIARLENYARRCGCHGDERQSPVEQLADAYFSEKERADRLQAELSTLQQDIRVAIEDVGAPQSVAAGQLIRDLSAKSDRLQHENETLRAARESLEPVGWMVNICDAPEVNKPYWCGPDVHKGTKRRVYLAPPQPLEDAQ